MCWCGREMMVCRCGMYVLVRKRNDGVHMCYVCVGVEEK